MKQALVVDDIKGIQLLLRKCLEAQNFCVTCCANGKDALELAFSARFDLIILDVKLPLVSGTEVLRRIRESGIDTPVIIITAFGSIKNAIDCTRLGVIAYIQKPFSENRILSVLDDFGLRADGGTVGSIERAGAAPLAEPDARLKALLTELAQDPLRAGLYRMLADESRALGREEDAEQYEKLYDALIPR